MLTPSELKNLLESFEEQPTKREIQAEREQRTRDHNVSSGMVQCSGCNGWFYDTPGNFCSFCAL